VERSKGEARIVEKKMRKRIHNAPNSKKNRRNEGEK
jgi:hypothetical protein